jgi:ribonuclease HI
VLKILHARAKELISQLDWFSIDHALREHNREADELANQAMDKGTGRSSERAARALSPPDSAMRVSQNAQEFEGIVRGGVVELLHGDLPEGTRVQVRIKK